MKLLEVQAEVFLLAVVGPVLYLALWLMVLPLVADLSTRLAVLLLALFTGAYCFAMSHRWGFNAPLWGAFGLLAGFVELGIVPVLLVGLIRSTANWAEAPEKAASE